MKITIQKRMTLGILGSTLLILIAILVMTYYCGRRQALEEVEFSVTTLARLYAGKFEGLFLRCSKLPRMTALHLESKPEISEEELKNFMKEMLSRNPEVYGTCVAFEPFSILTDQFYYAPYFYQKEGKTTFVQLGNEEYNYFTWDWYRLPKKANKALWTEPYFDLGGGETIMTTYSAPFYKAGAFWGIATIDISMQDMMADVRALQVGETGYAFILSRQGKFVTFPDSSRIMKGSLEEFDEEVAKRMTAGTEGIEPFIDPLTGKKAWIIYTPIPTSGWSLAMVYPVDELMAGVIDLQRRMLLIGGIGLLLIFAIITLLARSITQPLLALVRTAGRVAGGDLDQPLPPTRFRDEIWELSVALHKMQEDLKRYLEDLKRTITEKERIESELKIARQIQRSILPRTFPPFPNRREFDIYAVTIPAREVAGDFFDFFFIDENTLGFLIADVSGKGMPAALFMAVSRTLMKATALRGYSPGECLAHVNELLVPDNDAAMFVTVFYATLDLKTGTVHYANGGHNYPYVKRKNGRLEILDTENGLIVGVFAKRTYATHTLTLDEGDVLFLYTDGVTEAENDSSEFFTTSRLETYLKELNSPPIQEIINGVTKTVEGFCAGARQSDDITMLALRYFGKGSRE